MRRITLIALLVVTLAACNEDSSPLPDPIAEAKTEQNVQILDAFGQSATVFTQGEMLTFELSVSNTTNESATLGFSSGRQYDFYVRRSDDMDSLLWDPNPDKIFTQATTTIELQPFETKSFQQSWNQVQLDGSMLEAGTYVVEASFYNIYADSEIVEFQIN